MFDYIVIRKGLIGSTATQHLSAAKSTVVKVECESLNPTQCVTTYTPDDRPFIDVIEPEQLFIATGGCGHAAKSSDEIGRIAAKLVAEGVWELDLDWAEFKAIYAASP